MIHRYTYIFTFTECLQQKMTSGLHMHTHAHVLICTPMQTHTYAPDTHTHTQHTLKRLQGMYNLPNSPFHVYTYSMCAYMCTYSMCAYVCAQAFMCVRVQACRHVLACGDQRKASSVVPQEQSLGLSRNSKSRLRRLASKVQRSKIHPPLPAQR